MAPRKIKTQGKSDSTQIKSGSKQEKRAIKALKKDNKYDNSTENLKWRENESYQEGEPEWFRDGSYKLKLKPSALCSVAGDSEEYRANEVEGEADQEEQEEEVKYAESETSDECNCNYSQATKNRTLIKKNSSNSVVDNYIKSGMDQVASFIVESAIRFGEQHGVVIPDKNNPNLYEFTPTDKKFGEKFRKIRFKVPEKSSKYKEAKRRKTKTSTEIPIRGTSSSKASWQKERKDSIEKILPILKKIKRKSDFEADDLIIEKTKSDSDDTVEERSKERLKNRIRRHVKRRKSIESVPEAMPGEGYVPKGPKWRKFRRDSLELGRQRLRAANGLRNKRSTSQKSS